MLTADDETLNYITKLTDQSIMGLVPWSRSNPTTIVWQKGAPGSPVVRVAIQQLTMQSPTGVTKFRHIFSVTNATSNTEMISIHSGKDAAFQVPLMKLYTAADESIVRKGLQLLDTMMQS